MDTPEGHLGERLIRVVADTALLAQSIAGNVLMMSVAEDYTIEGVGRMSKDEAERIYHRLLVLIDESLDLAKTVKP
jgi:hypothetical protein